MIAIGAMSGTSCDGIDAVAIEVRHVDEPHEPRLLEHVHVPYDDDFSALLRDAAALPLSRGADLHREIGERYADAIARLSSLRDAAVIGMHGQTIWHAPPSRTRRPTTLQLGSGAVLAVRTGIPVVSDLRMADVARGGEGAPLVPFAHWFFTPPEKTPRAVVNFGGICNIN